MKADMKAIMEQLNLLTNKVNKLSKEDSEDEDTETIDDNKDNYIISVAVKKMKNKLKKSKLNRRNKKNIRYHLNKITKMFNINQNVNDNIEKKVEKNIKQQKIEEIENLLNKGYMEPKTTPINLEELNNVITNMKEEKQKELNNSELFVNLIKALSKTSEEIIKVRKSKPSWSFEELKKELGSSFNQKMFILSLLWDDNSIDNDNAFVYKKNNKFIFLDWKRKIKEYMDKTYEYKKNNNLSISTIYEDFIKYLKTDKKNKIWSKEILKKTFCEYIQDLGYSKKRTSKGFVISNIIIK